MPPDGPEYFAEKGSVGAEKSAFASGARADSAKRRLAASRSASPAHPNNHRAPPARTIQNSDFKFKMSRMESLLAAAFVVNIENGRRLDKKRALRVRMTGDRV
jgi:hypothetical protein